MITLFIFLAVLSVLVFVHEFGHFFVAKKARLRVDEFGIGFPPRLIGIRKKNVILRESRACGTTKDTAHKRTGFFTAFRMTNWEVVWGHPVRGKTPEASADALGHRTSNGVDPHAGGTLYSINLFPFGGFVRIKGESGNERLDQDSFASRGAGVRIMIAAGYRLGFPQAISDQPSKYAQISDQHIEVMGVLPDSPAAQSGLNVGDRILAVGVASETAALRELQNSEDFRNVTKELVGESVTLVVESDKVRREIQVTPKILEQTGKAGIGVAIVDAAIVRYPLWVALPKAFETVGILAKTIVVAFADIVRDALLGRPVTAELAGPVGIAVLTGQAARMGFVFLLQFIAILSINLAILNVLPIPALDGGRILFILIEKLRRRPVAVKVEMMIQQISFVLLLLLIIFVTYRDLGRYGGRITEFFKNMVQ